MKNVLITSIALIAFTVVSCNNSRTKTNENKTTDSLSKTQTAVAAGKSEEACCYEASSDDCSSDKASDNSKGKKSACCKQDNISSSVKTTPRPGSKLLVYAFHGTRQCTTCKNMKKHTKEALEIYFSNEIKSGEIQYFIVDVDDSKNEALAEKFEASGTALMINHIIEDKDHISDWSEFAFNKANDREVFIPEFKKLIEQELAH